MSKKDTSRPQNTLENYDSFTKKEYKYENSKDANFKRLKDAQLKVGGGLIGLLCSEVTIDRIRLVFKDKESKEMIEPLLKDIEKLYSFKSAKEKIHMGWYCSLFYVPWNGYPHEELGTDGAVCLGDNVIKKNNHWNIPFLKRKEDFYAWVKFFITQAIKHIDCEDTELPAEILAQTQMFSGLGKRFSEVPNEKLEKEVSQEEEKHEELPEKTEDDSFRTPIRPTQGKMAAAKEEQNSELNFEDQMVLAKIRGGDSALVKTMFSKPSMPQILQRIPRGIRKNLVMIQPPTQQQLTTVKELTFSLNAYLRIQALMELLPMDLNEDSYESMSYGINSDSE